MHSQTIAGSQTARQLLVAAWAWVRSQARRFGREQRARRAIEHLSAMDDRMLADIGMHRGSIGFAARHGRLPSEHAPLGLRTGALGDPAPRRRPVRTA